MSTSPHELDTDGRFEDVVFLAETGVGASETARRVGMSSAKSLDKWLRRRGEGDLANRLHHQEPLALVPSRKDR